MRARGWILARCSASKAKKKKTNNRQQHIHTTGNNRHFSQHRGTQRRSRGARDYDRTWRSRRPQRSPRGQANKIGKKKKKIYKYRLLKVSTSYTYIQQWFTLMQMPRRAMQKHKDRLRPRVAIGRLMGGSAALIASDDPAAISRTRRGDARQTFERSLGEPSHDRDRDREETSGSFCRSTARETPDPWIVIDRGVAGPSEVSHKSKPAVRCRI